MLKMLAAGSILLLASGPLREGRQEKALSAERVRALVHQLGAEDLETREQAAATLGTTPDRLLPELHTALKHHNVELRSRVRDVLDRMARPLVRLEGHEAEAVPKGKEIPVLLRIKNPYPRALVYKKDGFTAKIRILELFKAPPQSDVIFGRGSSSGRYGNGCLLSDSDFVHIQTVNAHEMRFPNFLDLPMSCSEEVLKQYPRIALPKPTLPGRYRIVVGYAYKRDKYILRCPKNCARHSEPSMSWNRCLDRPFTVSLDITIR